MLTRQELIDKIKQQGTDGKLEAGDITLRIQNSSAGKGDSVEAKVEYKNKKYEFNLWSHYDNVDEFYSQNFSLNKHEAMIACYSMLMDYLGIPIPAEKVTIVNSGDVQFLQKKLLEAQEEAIEARGKISVYERLTPNRSINYSN
jgi:hypothetical protein